jgi:hypothetical protein
MLDFKPITENTPEDSSSDTKPSPFTFSKKEGGSPPLSLNLSDDPGGCCSPSETQAPLKFEVIDGGNDGGCCTTSSDPITSKRSFQKSAPILPQQDTPMTAKRQVGFREYLGMFLCRASKYRNHYVVQPGLYALGNPHENSDVFVTANYKYSFDLLRKSLRGRDAWIVVLNTKGINVWCAAGKGTFGTTELVSRIRAVGLDNYVDHNRIIVPQLGAPGIHGREVKRLTGFRVIFGPVRADDIPEFLESNYRALSGMRRVRFNMWDRFVLVPMEVVPYFRYAIAFLLAALLLKGFHFGEMRFAFLESGSIWYTVGGGLSYLAGTALVPLFLPWIPFRSFALKGLMAGIAVTVPVLWLYADLSRDIWLILSAATLFPAASSYLALQFTGSTAFTGMTGVQSEIRYSLPYHMIASGLGTLLLLVSVVMEVFP